jgi:DNA-binding transcriptional LysR family regulator
MQIRRLEEISGTTLIDRAKRGGLRFTDDGEKLLAVARRMLELNDEALASIRPDKIAGSVRLGADTHYAVGILPPLLAEFSAKFPAIRIEILAGASYSATKLGKVYDLILALEPAGTTSGFVLARERAVWITSNRHQPHLLDPLPVAVLPEGSLTGRWTLEGLRRYPHSWRIAYITANVSAMLSAIEAGLAVGVVREGILTNGVRELTEEEGFPALPMLDITLTDAGPSLGRAAIALRDYLLQRLG